MSKSFSQPKNLSDLLVTEVAKGWTTQTLTLAPTSTDLEIGTLLLLAEGGQFKPATTQDMSANAILAENVTASEQPQKVLAIVRGAVIKPSGLVFPEGMSEINQKYIRQSLGNLGIVVEGESFMQTVFAEPVAPSEPYSHPSGEPDAMPSDAYSALG